MEALLNGEATGEARVLLSSVKLWWRCASPTASCAADRDVGVGRRTVRKLAITLLCKVNRPPFNPDGELASLSPLGR